ncbi:MAG: carboxypeptidase M32 [Solirubrobacteraceae bacterium]
MTALQSLRDRLAELADLRSLGALAAWDQHTMMPPAGAPARARQLATLERLAHERATAAEVGGWLDELQADGLDGLDADVVRLARRDWDRERRVPPDLGAERALVSAEGLQVWQAARAEGDFAAFAGALERNVELAREYARHVGDGGAPYDALLADFDFGLTAERIGVVFGRLGEALPPLVAQAAERPAPSAPDVPVDVQRAVVDAVLRRVGVDARHWRVDTSVHPFSVSVGAGDIRVTTRFENTFNESMLAALHEFGHGLYERQIPAELARTNLGRGTSMSVHESQSKLWENHVGRNAAFSPAISAELERAGHAIAPGTLHAAFTAVRPTPIRVTADELTYPLHIVLRFELELALIDGTLAVGDLPAAWNDGLRRLLGIEVADDREGVLQDMHWAQGAFGYFPSYALGCLIAAQLWERLEADAGPQDAALSAGDVTAVREWLGDNVHRHGRRLDTEPLVIEATGRGIDVEPFLRHAVRSRASRGGAGRASG